MKTLIVEDDFTSRVVLQELLQPYGEVHIAVNGNEALYAFENGTYDLICLDINMPEKDGHQVLEEIRRIEDEKGVRQGNGVKIMMITSLKDGKNVMKAFRNLCDCYLPKPFSKTQLQTYIQELKLI
ncbi:MAG TPA: response regulator [Candidatus Marinimicrobia bacterium]|nr:response regulator [Candidatus Neomarinimicrobiota bacterium]